MVRSEHESLEAISEKTGAMGTKKLMYRMHDSVR
jgi:hypothetical protein